MAHKSGQVPQIKATYVDHMGSDLSVVNAARVSFGKKSYCEETPLTREQQIELVETAKHRRNDMIKRLGCGEYDMLRHNANTDKGFK